MHNNYYFFPSSNIGLFCKYFILQPLNLFNPSHKYRRNEVGTCSPSTHLVFTNYQFCDYSSTAACAAAKDVVNQWVTHFLRTGSVRYSYKPHTLFEKRAEKGDYRFYYSSTAACAAPNEYCVSACYTLSLNTLSTLSVHIA